MVHLNLNLSSPKKEVLFFVGLTFLLTYFLNLIAYFKLGSNLESLAWSYCLRMEMLIPALVAIISLFVFRDSSVWGKARFLYLYYFVIIFVTIVSYFIDFLRDYSPLIVLVGTALVVALNLKKEWRNDLLPVKLSFGRNFYIYPTIVILFALLLVSSFYLNYLLSMGEPQTNFNPTKVFVLSLQTLVLIPLVGWVLYFGEEYGWRYYLQDRLFAIFGKIKGVLLLGVIWGLWHAPVIAMGYNYPGHHPVTAILTMVLFTVVVGIYYSFAVLKTGSVWVAVLLHGVTNSIVPIAMNYISYPEDSVFSFGMGLYAIMFFAIPAILIFKSDVWKE